MVINKTIEWLTWRWANTKIDKEIISLMKQTTHISKEDMKDFNLVMFRHAMDFFKKHASLKKLIPTHFFTSLLSNLLTKDLVTLGNLFSTKFMKPWRWLFATLRWRTWVPPKIRNKVLKQYVNHWMIGLAPKQQDIYDNKKKLKTDQATKIQSFPLHYGSKDLINKIYSNYVDWEQNINLRKIKIGLILNVKQIQSDCWNKQSHQSINCETNICFCGS